MSIKGAFLKCIVLHRHRILRFRLANNTSLRLFLDAQLTRIWMPNLPSTAHNIIKRLIGKQEISAWALMHDSSLPVFAHLLAGQLFSFAAVLPKGSKDTSIQYRFWGLVILVSMVEYKYYFHSLRIIDYAVSDIGEASLKIHNVSTLVKAPNWTTFKSNSPINILTSITS